MLFFWPVRVYYEDTDSGGVVYHANYLNFMERGRTEWLRSLGVEQDVLREKSGVIFAVCGISLDYRIPARFNESLYVSVQPLECRRASLVFAQQLLRVDGEPLHSAAVDKTVLCDGRIKIACLDAQTLKPCRIPADTRCLIDLACGELL